MGGATRSDDAPILSPEGSVRARVLVEGRVQGVFFRASCADEARRLGLAGWVRNVGDGRVEAVFEGAEQAVGSMIEWCSHGPAHAVVKGVRVDWEQPSGEASGFAIRG